MSNLMRLQLVLSAVDKMSSVVDKAVNRAQARMRSLGESAMSVGREGLAMGVGIGAALAIPIKQAVEFESGMANVRKVVDGLKDEKVFKEFTKDVMQLGRELPLAYNEITDMVAAGGRMGIARKELVQYTKDVAKMAVAFEMPAGEIGEQMGKLSKVFDIPINKIEGLADAINYLDDNSNAKGRDIIDVLQRVGGTARQVGMTGEQTAALASTFLSLGSSAEIAATASNAMMRELAIATIQPKRFQKALQYLGLDAKKLQKQMSVDAQGTILTVLDKLEKVKGDRQTEIGTLLFGKEYGDDAAKLATNVKFYREQIALLGDKAKTGSMNREFDARMKTTAAQMKIFKNNVTEVAIILGNAMLPAINSVMQAVRPYLAAFRDWAERNPELVAGIAKLAAVLAATSIATSALSFMFGGVLKVFTTGLSIFKALRSGAGMLGTGFKLVTKLGGLFTGVLGGVVKGIGFVGTAIRAVTAIMMANPIGLAVAAIAGAVYLIYKYWGNIKGFFSNLWEGTKSVFSSFTGWVGDWAGWLWEKGKGAMTGLWEGMKSMASSIGDWFASWWESDIEKIASRINYNGTFADAMSAMTTGITAGTPPAVATTGGGFAAMALTKARAPMQTPQPQPVAANVNSPTTNNQTVNFSPVINIQSAGGVDGFNVAMDKAKQDLARQLKEFQERQTRKSYQ